MSTYPITGWFYDEKALEVVINRRDPVHNAPDIRLYAYTELRLLDISYVIYLSDLKTKLPKSEFCKSNLIQFAKVMKRLVKDLKDVNVEQSLKEKVKSLDKLQRVSINNNGHLVAECLERTYIFSSTDDLSELNYETLVALSEMDIFFFKKELEMIQMQFFSHIINRKISFGEC